MRARRRRPRRCRGPLTAPRLPIASDVHDAHAPIFGLAYEHRALCRHPAARGAIELQRLPVVLDHVIGADHAPLLETEDLVVAQVPIPDAVVVHGTRRSDGEAGIVLGQIARGHIPVRGRVLAQAEEPHLLDQPVLLRGVIPLDAPFRLGAGRTDDRDVQLLAHAAKVRVRHVTARAFVRRGLPLVDILPVGVERPRHAIRGDPRAQHPDRGPNRLLVAEAEQRRAGRIIDHRHHTAPMAGARAAPFEPVVKAAVELDQLAEVRASRTPHVRRRLAAPGATPQPRPAHPAAQGRARDQHAMRRPQMLGHQRRPKTLPGSFRHRAPVVRADQVQDGGALGLRQRVIRPPPHIAVHQASSAARPKALQ